MLIPRRLLTKRSRFQFNERTFLGVNGEPGIPIIAVLRLNPDFTMISWPTIKSYVLYHILRSFVLLIESQDSFDEDVAEVAPVTARF